MRLRFWGTRANILHRSVQHPFHSALEIITVGGSILIDCGSDWREAWPCTPRAVVLTHGHDDHVDGLTTGTEIPVYATRETLQAVSQWPVQTLIQLNSAVPIEIGDVRITPILVQHSLRAPAVGLRIASGGKSVFYAPDVAFIPQGSSALAGIDLYIGDGSSLFTPLTRWEGQHLLGHASIPTQLFWCALAGVKRALFTHCGTELVNDQDDGNRAQVVAIGRQREVEADIACHGQIIILD